MKSPVIYTLIIKVDIVSNKKPAPFLKKIICIGAIFTLIHKINTEPVKIAMKMLYNMKRIYRDNAVWEICFCRIFVRFSHINGHIFDFTPLFFWKAGEVKRQIHFAS